MNNDSPEVSMANNALLEKEARLRKTQEMAHLGSWELDTISQNLIWSDEVYRIFGLQPQEFAATHAAFLESVHPDDRDALNSAYFDSIAEDRDSYEIEHRVVRKHTGEIRFVWEKCEHIRDDSGKIIRSVGMVQDITDRKLAEMALKESRERYVDLIELAVDGVLVGSPEGIIIEANSCICAMSGYTSEELIGKHIGNSFFSPGSLQQTPFRFDRLLKGEVVVSEREILRPDGSTITVEMRTKMMPNRTYQSIFRDISDVKRTEAEIRSKNEELQRSNSEKDKFFSILAHDLRSPFNGFLGLTQIMAEDLPDLTMDEIQKFVVMMRNSATNLYRLLENLLQWSRIQHGQIPFTPEVLPLIPVVDASMAMIREASKEKNINLTFDIPDNLVIYADNYILQTILRNLVSNAVKFTPKGGSITLKAKDLRHGEVEISICDSGIGMSPAIMENLFRLDLQTNRTGTDGEPSTGLGLLLCREFIHKHGGEIRVASEVGKGSVFSFNLPGKN